VGRMVSRSAQEYDVRRRFATKGRERHSCCASPMALILTVGVAICPPIASPARTRRPEHSWLPTKIPAGHTLVVGAAPVFYNTATSPYFGFPRRLRRYADAEDSGHGHLHTLWPRLALRKAERLETADTHMHNVWRCVTLLRDRRRTVRYTPDVPPSSRRGVQGGVVTVMTKSIANIANDLFFDKPKGELYHYTSLAGLLKIIKGRSLRFSDIRFFNDASEAATGSNILFDATRGEGPQLTLESIQEIFLNPESTALENFRKWQPVDSFLKWLFRRQPQPAPTYVGCFTNNGNILSQWRGYCPPSRGVSIGFDASRLTLQATTLGFSIGQCIYEPVRQREFATAVVQELRRHLPPTATDSQYSELSKDLEVDLLRIATFLKHPSFTEEQEWRIVSPPAGVEVPIQYREGKSMLIPYIEFELPRTAAGRLELEKVFLGPTQHPDLSRESLSEFLASQNAIPRQGVEYCGIPLRES